MRENLGEMKSEGGGRGEGGGGMRGKGLVMRWEV